MQNAQPNNKPPSRSRRAKPRPRPAHPKPPSSTPPPEQAGADLFSADFFLTLGVSETGKSADMKRRVRSEPRLVVWDPNSEHRFHGCTPIFPFIHPDPKLRDHRDDWVRASFRVANLCRAMLAAEARPARFAYVSDDMADFAAVCRLVRAWSEQGVNGRAPCAFLVEELGDVVGPGKAPRWWGMLGRACRHRGIKLRAVGHSPKEIDKTTLKMATTWRLHTLGSVGDAEYLAREIIGCDVAPLLSLPRYHFIEYDRHDLTRTPRRGITEKL